MPLEPTGFAPAIESDGVRFAMKDGENIVLVFVRAEALQNYPGASNDQASAFAHCRRELEAIASDIFDITGGNASIPVVIDSRMLNPTARSEKASPRHR